MYGVEILLTRAVTPALLSLYLPSTILTTLSWLSFLLPQPLVRLTLQLLITMIMLNIINTTRNQMPPANTITAVEIWFLGCLIMMLLCILELILERSTFRRPSNSPAPATTAICRDYYKHNEECLDSRDNGGVDTVECSDTALSEYLSRLISTASTSH